MKVIVLFSLAAIILGFLAGAGAGKIPRDEAAGSIGRGNDRRDSSGFDRHEKWQPLPSQIISNDSAATLKTVPGGLVYDRLALWLLDASASEVQEFWNENNGRADFDRDLLTLIFVNWARLDLAAAFAAVEGTKFTRYPWVGWTCHEPENALREVLADYRESGDKDDTFLVSVVLRSLGKYQPHWLRKNIDQLPAAWIFFRTDLRNAHRITPDR